MHKKVTIAFADRRLDPKDHQKDIQNAILNAKLNLMCRHKIVIEDFTFEPNGLISLMIEVPDSKDFSNAGSRLKGISKYLMNYCKFPYKNYLVGTRLLLYFD